MKRILAIVVVVVAVMTLQLALHVHNGSSADADYRQRPAAEVLEQVREICRSLECRDDVVCNGVDSVGVRNIGDPFEVYYYKGDSLVYWRNIHLSRVERSYLDGLPDDSLFCMQNGWYYKNRPVKNGEWCLYTFIRVTHFYPIANQYLTDGLNSSFQDNACNYFEVVVYVLWQLLLVIVCYVFYKRYLSGRLNMIVLLLMLVALYALIAGVPVPECVRSMKLFSSQVFSYDWVPNLWCMVSIAVLTLFYAIMLVRKLADGVNLLALYYLVPVAFCFLFPFAMLFVVVEGGATPISYMQGIDVQFHTTVKILLVTLFTAVQVIVGLRIFLSLRKSSVSRIRFSTFVWIMFVVTFIVCAVLWFLSKPRVTQTQQLLAQNMATDAIRDDDPVVEQLLPAIEERLSADTLLMQMVQTSSSTGEEELYDYLRTNYFGGYLQRYNVQIVLCNGERSTVNITSTGEETDCFSYFDNIIHTYGRRIAHQSNFYCLHYNNANVNYFGVLRFWGNESNSVERIYIELNLSRLASANGFPQLLRSDAMQTPFEGTLRGCSYAYYFGNANQQLLVDHQGSFKYADVFEAMTFNNDLGGRQIHMVLQPTEENTLVLTFPNPGVTDFIGHYSFLFVCLLVVCMLLLFVLRSKLPLLFCDMTIRDSIQSALVVIVLFLLLAFSIIQGMQALSRADEQKNTVMRDKLAELKADFIAQLQSNGLGVWETDFRMLMSQLARRYATDVHLYDAQGILLATSRGELFEAGLQSPMMNYEALQKLRQSKGVAHIQREQIGEMNFGSIYQFVYADNGVEQFVLNVPFFTDENERRIEVLGELTPVMNLYVVVIVLLIMISYLVARQITGRLTQITKGLRDVGLAGNKRIEYGSKDEIGGLVNAYNSMLEQLELQAAKLAATERENTWRQMARQIAHEIKNPLTPMKLSVQYMLRKWDAGAEDFDTFIRRTANTLVEQIDQLSAVASSFSDLAKSTVGEPEKVDVTERLQNAIMLFEREDDVNIAYGSSVGHAFVFINGGMLTQVFNNLLKNAQQARRDDAELVSIKVGVEQKNDNIVISIADDGKGIAAEVKENIFKPNFTTKQTGMGLGLAIVNNIIVNAGGRIWFESEVGIGTTFYVELPLFNME